MIAGEICARTGGLAANVDDIASTRGGHCHCIDKRAMLCAVGKRIRMLGLDGLYEVGHV